MVYRYRNQPNSQSRLIAGFVIIIGAIILFNVYQSAQNSAMIPTATPTIPAIVLAPTNTAAIATNTIDSQLWIHSDKAKLDARIVKLYYGVDNTWNLSNLGTFAGHLESTPPIGLGGNYVLAGHVELKDGTRGAFANLNLLEQGDIVSITKDQSGHITVLQYAVTEKISVAPDAIDAIRNHGYEELTLVTCSDYDITNNTYKTRLIIHARPLKM